MLKYQHYILSSYWFCSGSTIVGVGSPDPPQFIYDEEDYKDVFLSGKSVLLLCIHMYACIYDYTLIFNNL